MSQRTQSITEEIIIDLKLKVKIKQFSNHDGFKYGQIEKAIEEFKEEIQGELEYIISGEYSQQECITTVDYVDFSVELIKPN